MSVNLFAFLQKGARTVNVSFQGYDGTHKYLTIDDSIKVGSFVVVPYQPKAGPERLSVAIVKSVDACVKISANDPVKYKWVIARIDLSADTVRAEHEAMIMNMIEEAQRRATIKKLVEQTAEDLLPEDRNTLLTLTGN